MNKIPNKFFERQRILNILKESTKNKVTYLFAPIGSGKTVAVEQFEQYTQEQFYWFDCKFYKKINFEEISNKYIVLENFNEIKEEDKEYVLDSVLKNKKSRFIILSRKPIDINLKTLYYSGDLVEITVDDINFNIDEIKDFFETKNIEATNLELKQILTDVHGHSLVINMLPQYLRKEHYNERIYNAIKQAIVKYVEFNIFNKIETELMVFIKKISFINKVTIDAINNILNIKNAKEMLEKVESKGGFLYENTYGDYQFLYVVREYFQEEGIKLFGYDEIRNIYLKAAKYYEEAEESITYACEYYILAKEYEKGARTLIKQPIVHLGIIDYKEFDKYILQIPVKIIYNYPELCINLAHIYRVNDDDEKSIYWYNNFKEIMEKFADDMQKYERLNQMKMYYQICMPYTNDIKLIKYFQLLYRNAKQNTILDTITFTGNQPSILSGGKDLSNWGKHYKILYPLINKIVKIVFKQNQFGSGEIAVGEFLYENNKLEESTKFITKAISCCQNIDLLFVAYSILDKIYLARGEESSIIENFGKKIENKNVSYLIKNYKSRIIEKHILNGNMEPIRKWIYDNKINIIERFNLLERYSYFTLVRAYISIERYMDAIIMLERLHEYITKYDRTIYEIQYNILKSICLYRIKENSKSFESINKALVIAKKNNYIRLFTDEGLVVNEILKEYEKCDEKDLDIIKSEFYKQIIKESKKYGELYPNKYKIPKKEKLLMFTKKEIEILELIKQGKNNKEICEEQHVSLATVKTHINHIYSKLDTKNRIQTINKIKKEYK